MTTLKWMGVSALAGAAAALGHAPFGLWAVAMAGFVVLIWAVSRSHAPLRTAWAGGVGYFGVALHWIVEPFLVDAATHGWMAPGALVLMAGGLALFWAVAAWLARWVGGNGAVAFALALSLMEVARGYVFTGFPWALPAYIWTDEVPMSTAALIGPYGLTALTLVFAALPLTLARPKAALLSSATGLAIVMVVAFQGQAHLSMSTDGGGATVRLVQPNVPQNEKWDAEKAPEHLERLLTSTGAEGAPALIVWPETAVAYPLDLAGPILSRAAENARGATLVTGINRRTAEGAWFNAAVTVGAGGEVMETYDKVHLVPFGEYIPGRIDLLRRMASFTGFGFTPGAGVRLIDTPAGRALPLICYEAIFPRHAAGLTERPDYLLQITNDAWFGTLAGPYQHLQQAQFRAVEMGVPLVRAANTGVSAVIDPHGRVVADLALGKQGHLDVALPGRLPPTLYAQMGDRPVIAVLFMALLALALIARASPIAKADPVE